MERLSTHDQREALIARLAELGAEYLLDQGADLTPRSDYRDRVRASAEAFMRRQGA
jgi:hypothetical protein